MLPSNTLELISYLSFTKRLISDLCCSNIVPQLRLILVKLTFQTYPEIMILGAFLVIVIEEEYNAFSR